MTSPRSHSVWSGHPHPRSTLRGRGAPGQGGGGAGEDPGVVRGGGSRQVRGRGRGRGGSPPCLHLPKPQPQVFLFQKGSHRRCESLLSRSGEGCQFSGEAALGGGLWRRLTFPSGSPSWRGLGSPASLAGGEGRCLPESQVRRPVAPEGQRLLQQGRAAAAFRVGADGRPAPSPGFPSLLVRRPAPEGAVRGRARASPRCHLGAAGWEWTGRGPGGRLHPGPAGRGPPGRAPGLQAGPPAPGRGSRAAAACPLRARGGRGRRA